MATKMKKPKQVKHDELLTTQEVADLFNVPVRRVLRMIREGRLDAQKLGWIWLVPKRALPDSWPPPTERQRRNGHSS